MQVNSACSYRSLESGIAWEICKRYTNLFIRSGHIKCHHQVESLTIVDYVKWHRLLLDIVCVAQDQNQTFSIKKKKKKNVVLLSIHFAKGCMSPEKWETDFRRQALAVRRVVHLGFLGSSSLLFSWDLSYSNGRSDCAIRGRSS